MKLYDFVTLLPYMQEDCRNKNIDILNNAEKPKYIFGKEVPENLMLITYGEYSDLCDAIGLKDHIQAIYKICNILNPDVSEDWINDADVYDVWGYVTWVIKQVGTINDTFGSIKVDYTDQEKRAGIKSLQFGTFGILDWYARRMGIADQNLVNNEKWVRIFQCMKNDAEETAYNRRLQKIYEQDAKRKTRK